MFERVRKFLCRITGFSTPFGGVSWGLRQEDKSAYDTKEDFLIVTTVAEAAHVTESFILRTSVPRGGTVAEFLIPLRLQRALSRAKAQGSPPGGLLRDKAEPLALFDWSVSPLPLDLEVSKIAHGRVLIAIFGTEMAPAMAASITKESVRQRSEVQAFLKQGAA